MQQVDCITKLLGFQGFYVRGMRIQKDEDVEKVILDLGRERRYICSGCGREVYTKHSSYLQEVRHLHLWKYLTILRLEKVKVRCPTCGVRVERLDFLDKHARLTKDLYHQTGQLCKVMPVQTVATFEWLHWETVKEIDKRTIEKAQEERDLSGPF